MRDKEVIGKCIYCGDETVSKCIDCKRYVCIKCNNIGLVVTLCKECGEKIEILED